MLENFHRADRRRGKSSIQQQHGHVNQFWFVEDLGIEDFGITYSLPESAEKRRLCHVADSPR